MEAASGKSIGTSIADLASPTRSDAGRWYIGHASEAKIIPSIKHQSGADLAWVFTSHRTDSLQPAAVALETSRDWEGTFVRSMIDDRLDSREGLTTQRERSTNTRDETQ